MRAENWIALLAAIASLLTPLAIVVIGYILNKRFKHFERTLEQERRVSETRFELYREIGFKLNDIYAYFMYVGNWRDHSANDMIGRKRELDRHVFTYRPIFSQAFNSKYDRFILECFSMYGGWRKDARLRTGWKHRKEHDQEEWAVCFTQEDNRKAIKAAYADMMECLAQDLGLKR